MTAPPRRPMTVTPKSLIRPFISKLLWILAAVAVIVEVSWQHQGSWCTVIAAQALQDKQLNLAWPTGARVVTSDVFGMVPWGLGPGLPVEGGGGAGV